MKYFLYILLFFLSACDLNNDQDGNPGSDIPFLTDIQNFKKRDSVSFPPKNAILFIGSSSFTNWKDVKDYFPAYTIINRGFGGSTLLDQIRYADDIIFPYQPKQIVIYCGENDLASSDTVTAKMVFERFKKLYQVIKEKTNAPVAFISLKPSPSRRHLFPKMREANMLILGFITEQDPNSSIRSNMDPAPATFIDIHWKMLDSGQQPIPELFLDDSLHMTAKGYTVWQKEIAPYLLK